MWIDKYAKSKAKRVVMALCARLANRGPLSLALYERVLSWDIDYLASARIDYVDGLGFEDLVAARQILAFFQKQDVFRTSVKKEEVALLAFRDSERKCLDTNRRLSRRESLNCDVAAVLHYARRKISNILGRRPSLDTLDFRFGPGASSNVKSAEAGFRAKLSASPTCSASLLPYVSCLLEEVPLYTSHHAKPHSCGESPDGELPNWVVDVEVSDGNLTFVPKNAKTHRAIVVEPTLNGLFQKGIGSYMKARLLRVGVDLTDQSRNQTLAYLGSLGGCFATVDLKAASDSISYMTVLELLPIDWFELLEAGRSEAVTYCGERIELEKFSSMGNGYTFELESLIFYALSFAVCVHLDLPTHVISVYGDDIIIHPDAVPLLEEVFTYLGFSINRDKSYTTGPFRESCGHDYYLGFDIRPFYLREEMSDRVLYAMHNFFVRSGDTELASLVREFVHPDEILWGPNGYGDGHLIGSHTLRTSRRLRRDGWCGGFFDTYSLGKRINKKPRPGDWLVPSYSVYIRAGETDPCDPDIVRGSKGYRRLSIYTLATAIF